MFLLVNNRNSHNYRFLGDSQVDMRGAAYEAVLLYCECATTKQIGLPEG